MYSIKIIAIFALLASMLGVGIVQAYPSPVVYPLSVSIGNSYQTVAVGGNCFAGTCVSPAQAVIQATITGGTPPYTVVVMQNNQQVQSTSTSAAFYEYDFVPPTVGTYSIQIRVTDSASPPNSYSASAVVVGAAQSGSGSSVGSASLSINQAVISTGQSLPITVTVPGSGTTQYSVTVSVNGGTKAIASTYSTYTYTLTPPATGQYNVEFDITDPSGNEATLTASVTATPSGGNAAGSGASGGPLALAISPAYTTVAAYTPVAISATASGGSGSYTISIHDISGSVVASSTTSTVSYTATPSAPNSDFPYTIVVTDSAGDFARQIAWVHTTSSSGSGTSQLSLSANPPSQSVPSGQSFQISVTPSGGLAPYYVTAYDGAGDYLTSGRVYSVGTPFVYSDQQNKPGTYTYSFSVMDSAFNRVSGTTASVVVGGGSSGGTSSPSAGMPDVSLTPQSASAAAHQIAQFNVVPSGGTPPYSLVVRDQFANILGSVTIPSAGSQFVYSASEASPGSYFLSFQIVDSNSQSFTRSAVLTVT